MEPLGCAGLTFKAFAHADLRAVLVDRRGAEPADCTPTRLAYDLQKLRDKGLVRKAQGRNLYTLTDLGYRVARTSRSCTNGSSLPTFDGLDAAVHTALGASSHRLDRALVNLNACFDQLAAVLGVKLAT